MGAHPGYPDREGFGRRKMAMKSDELRSMILVPGSCPQRDDRGCRRTRMRTREASRRTL
ncbi:MAG: LamB/YcsF family protein [Marinilabiliales bacterium]|nr:LamB/YcsF family protein [Marinilabiliales bacterium]